MYKLVSVYYDVDVHSLDRNTRSVCKRERGGEVEWEATCLDSFSTLCIRKAALNTDWTNLVKKCDMIAFEIAKKTIDKWFEYYLS